MKSPLLIALLMLLPLLAPAQMPYAVKGKMGKDRFFTIEARNTITKKKIQLSRQGISIAVDDSTVVQSPLPKREGNFGIPLQHDMITYTSFGDTIYILRAFGGMVALDEYTIANDTVKERQTYTVDSHRLLSIANFGECNYQGRIEKIDNALYIYVAGGQSFGAGINGLYKLNLFGKKRVMKINMDNLRRRIWVYQLSDFGRSYYKQEKEQLNWHKEQSEKSPDVQTRESHLRHYERMKRWLPVAEEHLDKPYYLKDLSIDDKENKEQRTYERNENNFQNYPLFDDIYFEKPNPAKGVVQSKEVLFITERVEACFHEVLLFAEGVEDVVLLAQMPMQHHGVYFFYRQEGKVKMLLYNHGLSEWQFADYTEELPQKSK